MNEWRKVKLGEVAKIKGGKRLPKGASLQTKKNSHPYIRIKDMTSLKNIELNQNFEYVPDEIFKNIKNYLVNKNDIILSIVGTIGLINKIGSSLNGANLTENCVKITIKDNIITDYLYYYLISIKGQKEIKKGVVGAVQPKLPIKNIEKIKIKYPFLNIQKKISKFLSDIDEKIELNNKINDNLEKQALLFFKKLLSNEQNNYCKLSDIALINPKYMLNKNIIARYIDMAELSTSNSFPNGWKLKKYNGGMRFKNNDTLLARITPCLENGKSAFINFLDENEIAFGSTEYIVISSKGEYPPEFFYCLTKYPIFLDFAIKNMNGSSGRQRVSGETIGNFILPKLDNKDLKVFSKIASSIFNTIKCKNFENIYLTNLKNYLLPKLINGEIDVENIKL